MSSADNNASAIIDAAVAAVPPTEIDPTKHYSVVVPDGHDDRIIRPLEDRYLDAPRRKVGTSVVNEVDGLAFLWDKHADADGEVYADQDRHVITAVVNADKTDGSAGHRDHRIELVCLKSTCWQAWLERDGQYFGQQEFAEFIEDRVAEISNPTGATMLEIAQSFQATTKVDFKSVAIVSSGQRGIVYDETVGAKAGQEGTLDIPATFTVALQPFVGGPAYETLARFRFRIRDGKLALGFKLERPEEVIRSAFKDVADAASEATGRPVLLGKAPGPRS